MKLIDLFEMKYNLGIARVGGDDEWIRYLRSTLPNFPEYVLQDWIKETASNVKELEELMAGFEPGYGPFDKIQWTREPQVLDFKMEMFDDFTLERFQAQGPGKRASLPKDDERHQTQANLLKGKNPKKDIIVREPVIMFRHGKKYELIEGWHRTIQAFKLYPDGYKGYAFVGKPGR